jgi:hypothetical protein
VLGCRVPSQGPCPLGDLGGWSRGPCCARDLPGFVLWVMCGPSYVDLLWAIGQRDGVGIPETSGYPADMRARDVAVSVRRGDLGRLRSFSAVQDYSERAQAGGRNFSDIERPPSGRTRSVSHAAALSQIRKMYGGPTYFRVVIRSDPRQSSVY